MHQSAPVPVSDSWMLESDLGSDWNVEFDTADLVDDSIDYAADNSQGNTSTRVMSTLVTRDRTVVAVHFHTSFIRGPPA
jgi:hypothetical protein